MIDLKRQKLPRTKPDLIHMRKGDLMRLIESNDSKVGDQIISQLQQIQSKYPHAITAEYCQDVVNRDRNHMIESMADLIIFSKECNLVAYCPYSWFSSWIVLLSDKYNAKLPVFNVKNTYLVEIQ
jgi:hypothetical protein